MQWAVLSAAFLASAVEFVEAFTIVLVVGVTINWRSSLVGAFAAAATLALIVGTLGVALVQFVHIDILRMVVGTILILFGLKWLKKSILRYSGLKAIHDEEAIFEETRAEVRARGGTIAPRFEPFGIALSYKAVLLEGLEVAFIVITFGSSATSAVCNTTCGIGSAAIGAAIAGVLVILAGALVRAPLTKVPENSLKFVVGVMLTTFGTFWAGEGFGVNWPFADAFLLALAALYLLASFVLVLALKQSKQRRLAATADTLAKPGMSTTPGLESVENEVAGDNHATISSSDRKEARS
ncbi:MAG TPA: hypothetical protein VEV19_17185 [Ktedonobacteraceae bacterium]|nr:hypothetical protein [Ktedonobacteraceae bacterium]